MRIKHLVTEIMEAALDTGYEFEFLCRMVDELVEDGESMREAVSSVIETAYELDY